jgi:hypothetical protein
MQISANDHPGTSQRLWQFFAHQNESSPITTVFEHTLCINYRAAQGV